MCCAAVLCCVVVLLCCTTRFSSSAMHFVDALTRSSALSSPRSLKSNCPPTASQLPLKTLALQPSVPWTSSKSTTAVLARPWPLQRRATQPRCWARTALRKRRWAHEWGRQLHAAACLYEAGHQHAHQAPCCMVQPLISVWREYVRSCARSGPPAARMPKRKVPSQLYPTLFAAVHGAGNQQPGEGNGHACGAEGGR